MFRRDGTLLGVVKAFEYLRWTRRYSHCGSFELKAIATPKNTELLRLCHYLWKSDDEEAGIIEFRELAAPDRETIHVSGRFATSFLGRRIVWGTETLTGDLSACVWQLLGNHLIHPSNPARRIDGIAFSSPVLGIPVQTQTSYRNLLDVVTGLCDAAEVGIKMAFDPAGGPLRMSLYHGGITQAVFSRDYENVIDQVYTQSLAGYANAALIGGEGEGSERVFIDIANETGEDRYELFVDAKDLREEDFGGEYEDALLFRGEAKLRERAMIHAFDASVNPHGNLAYKQDYDLGGVVRVLSPRWNLDMTARITEVEESYDADGRSLRVVFGKQALSLIQRLKEEH
jgi:hypothetical protein